MMANSTAMGVGREKCPPRAPIAFVGAIPSKLDQRGKPISEPTFAALYLSPCLFWRLRVIQREDLSASGLITVELWNGPSLAAALARSGFLTGLRAVTNLGREEIARAWRDIPIIADKESRLALAAVLDDTAYPTLGTLSPLAHAVLLALSAAKHCLADPPISAPAERRRQKPLLEFPLDTRQRISGTASAEVSDPRDVAGDSRRFGLRNARFPKQDFLTGRLIPGRDLTRKPRPDANDLESDANDVVEHFGVAVDFVEVPLQALQPFGRGFSFHDRAASNLFSAATSPQGNGGCNAQEPA